MWRNWLAQNVITFGEFSIGQLEAIPQIFITCKTNDRATVS